MLRHEVLLIALGLFSLHLRCDGLLLGVHLIQPCLSRLREVLLLQIFHRVRFQQRSPID